VLVY
jgi:hypothetical protein